ncbi:hypothetical protein [Sphaerochaeta sp.]|uniref:hypothetical protein n=1 Tax=Sphaerochaeta sp. TaxID=1972642 RepID=UPI003D104EA0
MKRKFICMSLVILLAGCANVALVDVKPIALTTEGQRVVSIDVVDPASQYVDNYVAQGCTYIDTLESPVALISNTRYVGIDTKHYTNLKNKTAELGGDTVLLEKWRTGGVVRADTLYTGKGIALKCKK